MSKFTKKWQKEFEKRYSTAVIELKNLEAEYKEMKDTNPDEWSLNFMTPKESELDFGVLNDYSIYDYGDKVDIRFNGSIISVDFSITELKKLIEFRNELMKAIDTFERPLEKEKVVVDTNDCEDEEDLFCWFVDIFLTYLQERQLKILFELRHLDGDDLSGQSNYAQHHLDQ